MARVYVPALDLLMAGVNLLHCEVLQFCFLVGGRKIRK